MEDKRMNRLNDEELEKVTGGLRGGFKLKLFSQSVMDINGDEMLRAARYVPGVNDRPMGPNNITLKNMD